MSIYIIDFAQKGFLYVSPHPLLLSGYTQQEVKELGHHFCKKILSPEDLQMLLEVDKMGFDFFYTLPVEERSSVHISCNFYLHHKNGEKFLIHHKLVPMRFTPDGNLWMAVCFVSYSPHKEPGHVVLTTLKKEEYYQYNFERHKFVKYTPKKLSKREFEILNLTMRGYEEPQIAELLHVSPYTIKSHRRKIIKKMGVNNLSNAVSMFYSQFHH
ncbi:MAG: PAS and helix-turn-helix domain-containing protein [Bacteroidales bacterium]|nr:PAS and helix-turn-helix domain-containing protein [Bacteroidales bacterium]